MKEQQKTAGTLFEPVRLGNLTLKNHLARSATWENMATAKGHMTGALYRIYETLAKNEVGLIITGYANVLKEEQPNPGMMGIYDDSFIPEYKELTSRIHAHGAKIIMQVAYGGTKTSYRVGERVIYAPSDVPERKNGTQGKAMTMAEILKVEDAFADAARRIQAAGFDGVEIHGAHTYLINQFLSPYYNRRQDGYGGSLENRMRFLLEICEKVRAAVGDSFFVAVKLTASEFFEGGQTFTETIAIAKALEKLGIDAIELSGNIHGKALGMDGQTFDGHTLRKNGFFLDYARDLARQVRTPIITVGGFRDVETAGYAVNDCGIACVALARPLMAEPDLFARWKRGDTAPAICLNCNRCREGGANFCRVFQNNPME